MSDHFLIAKISFLYHINSLQCLVTVGIPTSHLISSSQNDSENAHETLHPNQGRRGNINRKELNIICSFSDCKVRRHVRRDQNPRKPASAVSMVHG